MDPWSKGDYSRHIREASMAMDGLPEGVSPSGRVPEQLLKAAPILKRRRRRYREVFAKKGSVLGVSTPRGKYRRRGASRGPTRQPGGLLARPRVGPRQGLTGINPGKSHGQGPWVSYRKHRLDDKLVSKQEDTFLLDIFMMAVQLEWMA